MSSSSFVVIVDALIRSSRLSDVPLVALVASCQKCCPQYRFAWLWKLLLLLELRPFALLMISSLTGDGGMDTNRWM